MQYEDLMRRYFAVEDPSQITPAAMEAGTERMLVDFGLEKDRTRRFALWSLLLTLGRAPDLDVAFKLEEDREAARNLMDLMAAAQDGEEA